MDYNLPMRKSLLQRVPFCRAFLPMGMPGHFCISMMALAQATCRACWAYVQSCDRVFQDLTLIILKSYLMKKKGANAISVFFIFLSMV
jgi:hypothetical protein